MLLPSLFAFLLNFLPSATPATVPLILWHEGSIFQLPTQADPKVQSIFENYLEGLEARNLPLNQQGIWIQSHWATLADNRGTIPAPAASITKVATTLVALEKWSLDHQFVTNLYIQGDVNNNILEGDLIIEAGGDPFFVWEDAIALGSTLEQLGIENITGNLIVVGDWQMNFRDNINTSAENFKQALNVDDWSYTVEKQYRTMENPPIPPQIKINGQVIIRENLPDSSQLLHRHNSLTLREILRAMNVYSNNSIAEFLAQQLGGGKEISAIASRLSNVPPEEIQLINGSGLGVDNRISPRAACRMLIAIEQKLTDTNINLGDLFPVTGLDTVGTIEERTMPPGLPVKTGSLAVVSALSGAIDIDGEETIYFAIMNYGNGLDDLRARQDQLLTNLGNYWQIKPILPQSFP